LVLRTGYAAEAMVVLAGSILLAIFVVPAPWGQLLVGGALLWEIAEKLFFVRYSKRMPPLIGREALIGLPVTAVSACLPEGWVKLRGERWKARCNEGAGVGDSLVVEAVDQITLVVAQPPSDPAR
jgi:membrane-bound ClpP family serine protease